ncbi:MFS transporter [Alicyclobacillus sp. ALC3]|uniref:MFS transporter n=1 Tax=Alicyclobacillus sp. ALC3 TaxID=2796143 RepID=UPI0023784CC6|nr:MFS transporter [Alicyclobacillus sp. ALC3]
MSANQTSFSNPKPDPTKKGSFFPLPSVYRRPNYHWFVVATVCIGAFMAAVDASIVNITLPVLQRQFHVTLSTVTWVSLTYLLTLAALIIPLGRLADMFGRRWMYAIGFTVFIIGSLLCGLSPNLTFLLASRVLQAVGAAMLQANSVSIITATTPASDRGKAIGIQGAAQAIGLSLGPAIGGTLLSFATWRWVFFVNVPVGIIGTVLGILMLPPDGKRNRQQAFDYLGAIILAPTLVALIYFLNTGKDQGWGSPVIVGSYIVAALGMASFIVVERRSQHPMLDLSMLKIPSISVGSITGVLSFAVMYAVTLLGPFYFDRVQHLQSYQAGLYMTVIPLGMTIFTPVSGALADRFGTRILTVSGMLIAALGSVGLALATGFTHGGVGIVLLVAGFFFIGAGLGFFTPPNNSSVMGSAPKSSLGVVGGLLNMSRTMGMSIGVTLGGLSYQVFLVFYGVGHEGQASQAQMVAAFRGAYLFVAVIAIVALILSGSRKFASSGSE